MYLSPNSMPGKMQVSQAVIMLPWKKEDFPAFYMFPLEKAAFLHAASTVRSWEWLSIKWQIFLYNDLELNLEYGQLNGVARLSIDLQSIPNSLFSNSTKKWDRIAAQKAELPLNFFTTFQYSYCSYGKYKHICISCVYHNLLPTMMLCKHEHNEA